MWDITKKRETSFPIPLNKKTVVIKDICVERSTNSGARLFEGRMPNAYYVNKEGDRQEGGGHPSLHVMVQRFSPLESKSHGPGVQKKKRAYWGKGRAIHSNPVD